MKVHELIKERVENLINIYKSIADDWRDKMKLRSTIMNIWVVSRKGTNKTNMIRFAKYDDSKVWIKQTTTLTVDQCKLLACLLIQERNEIKFKKSE